MSTASNAASGSGSASTSGSGSEPASENEFRSESESGADESESDSASLFDRLQTVGTIVWATFLALVVVLTLIPAVALWFGAVPFDAPPTAPYFAFVAAAFVGTAALIAAGIYDV